MKFEELNLPDPIMRAVRELGFENLTSIQEQSIPLVRQGCDVVGQSSTGSGKTAAFGLPILEKITPGAGLQVLVLTPTRELCEQVADMLKEFAKHMHVRVVKVYGGVGIMPQIEAIEKADIVVGTPGRVLDHLQRQTIAFDQVRFLVLDEADKMFEMGFIEDVEHIISFVPSERQTLLFSATMYASVRQIVAKHLRDPQNIQAQIYVDKSLLRQVYYQIGQHEKFSLLVSLLKHKTPGLAMVFCATRSEVDIVSRNLKLNGVRAMAIHGGLSQQKRLIALDALKKEDIQVLVATDVAARGLDIRNITHVYNYDVPKTSEEYVHRIGRTARAGTQGDAITLLTERDYENFGRVLTDRSLDIRKLDAPHIPRVRFQRREPMSVGFERGESRFGSRDSFSRRGPGQRTMRDGHRQDRFERVPPHASARSGEGHQVQRRDSEQPQEHQTSHRKFGERRR